MNILLADNNDSFTRNLEHCLFAATGSTPQIVRYEHIIAAPHQYQPEAYDLVVISPGPGAPDEYTGYGPFIDSGIPVLGICLGLQIINQHFGGKTSRLAGCVHGKQDTISLQLQWEHPKDAAFPITPLPTLEAKDVHRTVARYHSLHISRVGQELEVFAKNTQGIPMAIRHKQRPLAGYQFHPESFLTDNGVWYIHHALGIFSLN